MKKNDKMKGLLVEMLEKSGKVTEVFRVKSPCDASRHSGSSTMRADN